MRKGLFRLTVALTALTAFLARSCDGREEEGAHFKDRRSRNRVGDRRERKSAALARKRAVGVPKVSAMRLTPVSVQRGQAWWPYGSSQAPYNAVGKRAEAMTEDEIQVNGVALLNVRDVEATLRLMPRDLKLPEGAQLTRPDGFFLVKIEGFSRTQEQLDALRDAESYWANTST